MQVRMECMRHYLQTVEKPGTRPAEKGIAIRNVYPASFDGSQRLADLTVQHVVQILESAIP